MRTLALPIVCAAVLLLGLGPVWGMPATAEVEPRIEPPTAQPADEESLRAILAQVAQTTGYEFLYRDALISDKHAAPLVAHRGSPEAMLATLEALLAAHGIGMHVDHDRRQVLLYPATGAATGPRRVSGYVVDAERGFRLPFATLIWEEDGRTRGVVTNEDGAFQAQVAPGTRLRASYVGYEAHAVRVPLGAARTELTLRLSPSVERGPEVVVNSSILDTDVDTTWQNLIQPALAAPFGEQSVLRALQPLPAVSISGAFSDGLNVRGSRADGFQVLLDGAPIYNQSHFFGLFDAFNEDALQTVAFYYGIAPATFSAPPGGTLSFVTRPGSQRGLRQQVGVSSAATRATAEGPLLGGRGSWLVSGRHSYLNQVSWFNNDRLVAHGLDIDRPSRVVSTGDAGPTMLSIQQAEPSVRFFDLHGKIQLEWEGGHRLMASGYLGGDRTSQQGQQGNPFVSADAPDTILESSSAALQQLLGASTRNEWGNEAFSLQWQQPLPNGMFGRTTVAASRYYNTFEKNDFVYTRIVQPDGTPASAQARHFLAPFQSENRLLNLKAEHLVEGGLGRVSSWSAGATAQYFDVSYQEETAPRPRFSDRQESTKVDLFGQVEWKEASWLNAQVGLRSHYATGGNFWRLSPRLHARLFPKRRLSLSAGYSTNHQFLHRLSLERNATGNIWVMSSPEQPPTRVHHTTAGVHFKASPRTLLQVEGYLKSYDNLRQHESLTPASTMQTSVLLSPWRFTNTADARGIEVMGRQRLGPVDWTTSYTLARVELRSEDVNGGQPFAASWDRRHELTTHLKAAPTDAWTVHLNWMWASGAPNTLAFTDASQPDRLGPYHRLDASLQYRQPLFGALLDARLGLFNLYDRNNPWYRTPLPQVAMDSSGRPEVAFETIEVFDLGFHPSLEFTVSF